jgi:hypothetical protein
MCWGANDHGQLGIAEEPTKEHWKLGIVSASGLLVCALFIYALVSGLIVQ